MFRRSSTPAGWRGGGTCGRKQEFLYFLLRRGELVGKGGDGAVRAADVVDAGGPERRQPRPGLAKGVLDEAGDDPAHQFMDHPHPLQARVQQVDLVEQPPQEIDLAQVVEREQAGAQAVVNVMGVIGDVVGQRRALRLGVGVEFKIKGKYSVESMISCDIFFLA